MNAPDKNINTAIFDSLDIRNIFVEVDRRPYPRDSVILNYTEIDCFDQNGDFKIFYKEYVGGELMIPFISYPDLKTKYPIQVIDLRLQSDRITHKTIQLFEEYRNSPANARLLETLTRRREVENQFGRKNEKKLKL